MSKAPNILTEEQPESDVIEIRLSSVWNFLYNGRKWAMYIGLSFLTLGAVYAFLQPNLYSSKILVMPELQSKGNELGGLGSLAGLAGIDIGGTNGVGVDIIRPDIYPNIIQSAPFALHILRQPVYSQILNKKTSLKAFIEEQNNKSFLNATDHGNEKDNFPKNSLKDYGKTLKITKEQKWLIEKVHNSVKILHDKKNGIITISTTFEDPAVAATVAQLSLEYLTDYITSYRTGKARNQAVFLTRQVEEAKNRYQRAEYNLSNFKDQNRSLFLNTARIEEQRLQSDFLLAQSLLSDLSKQLEQAKIKVSEESPIFKVLEPAQIPIEKSAPKRLTIILGLGFLGVSLGYFIYGLVVFVKSQK